MFPCGDAVLWPISLITTHNLACERIFGPKCAAIVEILRRNSPFAKHFAKCDVKYLRNIRRVKSGTGFGECVYV